MSHAVRIIEAVPMTFVPRATGYGTVQPGRVWEAIAQVSGKIIDQHPQLEKGRLIPAEAVILRIDPIDYELAIARSEANLQSARAKLTEFEVKAANTHATLAIEQRALRLVEEDLTRQQALLKRGNTSQALVDQAETAFLTQRQRVQEVENQLRLLPAERRVLEASMAQNQAQLKEARLNLERTMIQMPFAARLAEVNVEPTEFVNIGEVLVVADSIDVAEVVAQFPIGRISLLVRADIDLSSLSAGELAELPGSLGLEATVRLRPDGVTASWAGRFERLSERIDPQMRTVGMIVAVAEPYRQAIPGKRPPLVKNMFVEVEWHGRPRPDIMVMPRTALHRNREGAPVLYLVNPSGRLEIRQVTRGPVQRDLVVIEAGLTLGERVIVSDLIPAIAGMKLEAHADEALGERLRLEANGKMRQEASRP